jgi:orotate phosphoribosyltransferase
MAQNSLQELIKLIRELSYRKGDFVLSSGKRSPYYIDLKATSLHPDGAYWIGEAAVDLLVHEGIEIQGVGGLTLGADPLATAISLAARARGLKWPAFIVRKESKNHGTLQYVEGQENLSQGASLLVLEDVLTTGASALKAVRYLREAGYSPIATLAVLDREEGREVDALGNAPGNAPGNGRHAIESEGLRFFALTRLSQILQ